MCVRSGPRGRPRAPQRRRLRTRARLRQRPQPALASRLLGRTSDRPLAVRPSDCRLDPDGQRRTLERTFPSDRHARHRHRRAHPRSSSRHHPQPRNGSPPSPPAAASTSKSTRQPLGTSHPHDDSLTTGHLSARTTADRTPGTLLASLEQQATRVLLSRGSDSVGGGRCFSQATLRNPQARICADAQMRVASAKGLLLPAASRLQVLAGLSAAPRARPLYRLSVPVSDCCSLMREAIVSVMWRPPLQAVRVEPRPSGGEQVGSSPSEVRCK